MSTLTYCDNGHLWDRETGKPCGLCRKEHLARLRGRLADVEEGMADLLNLVTHLLDELDKGED